MNIHDMYEGSQEDLSEVQGRELVLIPEGVYMGEDMSLRRSLRKKSMVKVLNKGLVSSVVETNIHLQKRERPIIRGEGLSMIVTYTQV